MMAYGCARHRDRGNAVCPVTVYQSKQEVEAALVDQLQTYVLGESALAMVIGQIRAEIEAQLPKRRDDMPRSKQSWPASARSRSGSPRP